MTKVVVRNGNVDGALKKFKQKVAKSGIPSECKKREHYSKPGIQRREAKKAGIKNSRKRQTLYLKIGNKYFNLFKYKNMDREVLVSYKNRLLPFEFGIEKQSEVKIINDKLSIKEAKNKAIFKAKQELLDTLDKDEYIIDQKALNFYQKNSKIVLDMFFTCYEEIGEEETITLEE